MLSTLVMMLAPVHRSGLWLLLGAFSLLGLFAMHGLGGHGINHGTGANQQPATLAGVAGVAEVGGASHASGGVGHDGCSGPCAPEDSTTQGSAGYAPGGGNAMVMVLCLAVLAAAVAVGVLAIRRMRLAVLQAPRLVSRLETMRRSARDHDPPGIYVLSVQRC